MPEYRSPTGVSAQRAALTAVLCGLLLTGFGVTIVWDGRGWPGEVYTTATLISSTETPARANRKGTYYEFQYAVPDGRQVVLNELVSSSGSLYQDGDSVTVLYSPDAPEQGRLWVSRGGAEFLPALGGIALSFVGLWGVIHELLKRRRTPKPAGRGSAGPRLLRPREDPRP
ncbi:DUF3592 domain-containing protein [Micromonospora sp. NPDC048835]|uniref:DUF3592 domain-containing protein n=1 Tax=Micromonospora sp. NPDC048835 TaxID=3155147 RepID=UPI0033F9D17C